jgi:hypothetical protein
VFVIVLPFVGVLVCSIAQDDGMRERNVKNPSHSSRPSISMCATQRATPPPTSPRQRSCSTPAVFDALEARALQSADSPAAAGGST